VKRLGEAQKLKAIYTARVAHHERQLTQLATELEASARGAESELIGLVNGEAGRPQRCRQAERPGVVAIDGNPEVLIGAEAEPRREERQMARNARTSSILRICRTQTLSHIEHDDRTADSG
jgi:hypothetical protein